MANFEIAYKKTGGWEGGWNHVANDRGGETYCGIARKFHPTWAGWKIIDQKKKSGAIKKGTIYHEEILENLVYLFYKTQFWDIVGGDKIEDQNIANTLYDFGVNAGNSRSIKNIQQDLGLPITGKINAILIDAINNPENYLI